MKANRFSPSRVLGMALAGAALLGVAPLRGAVIPYSNDFSGSGSNVDFDYENTETGQSWTLQGGEYRLRGTSTAGGQLSASAVQQITNAGDYATITMETKFRLPASPVTPNGSNFSGLAAFGLTSGLEGSGASTAYYLADWLWGNNSSTNVGQLRVIAVGDTSGYSSSNGTADDYTGSGGANWAAQADTVYTLRLTAALSGGTLNLTFGVYDAAGTTQIGTSATGSDTSPLTGQYFGLRSRIGSGSSPQDLFFDDFTIIPEPGSMALALAGGVLARAIRRRRMRA